MPGVVGVTASTVQVLDGSNRSRNVSVQGYEAPPDTTRSPSTNSIAPDYFRTMGIPLIAGREFTRSDASQTPKVAIVNEAFARRFGLDRDAVGKRMRVGSGDDLDIEIVGLVQDAKYSDVKGEIPAQYFVPYRQDAATAISFYLRTASDPDALLSVIPRVVSTLDANLPVERPRTMEDQIRDNVVIDRFIGTAAVGLYGVLAYTVTQRTREIGLRMALGADGARVRRMILGQVGWMTVVGGVVGLALAVGAGRLAQSLLFEIQGHDPLTIAVPQWPSVPSRSAPGSFPPCARPASSRCVPSVTNKAALPLPPTAPGPYDSRLRTVLCCFLSGGWTMRLWRVCRRGACRRRRSPICGCTDRHAGDGHDSGRGSR